MDALEVLKNRRSVRKFKKEQVPDDLLKKVLEAGTYAPTAMGSQKPYIIAVQNADDVKQLNRMNGRVMGNENAEPYYGAPTILLILAPAGYALIDLDCASICTNMVNAAYACGLGSVWVNRSKEMFSTEEGKALLKKWGFDEELQGSCSIALGYADCELPQPKPRKENYCTIIR